MSRVRSAIKRALVVVESDAMQAVARDIEAVAARETPVVIEGETGTGRELIARVIHHAGPRGDAPFVTIEPGGGPRFLVGDELSEPDSRPVEDASGGSLLVKDLCELDAAAQRRLCGLLDGGEGDVRVIGSCNEDLEAAVEAGVFDAALFERMAGQRIVLPPLRERVADVPPLASHFVREYGRAIGRDRMTLSTRAHERLITYPWPGNVAELKIISRRLVIRTRGTRIEAADVDAVLPPIAERIPLEEMSFEDMVRAKVRVFLRRVEGYPLSGLYEDVLARVERPLLNLIMEHTGGNQLKAAEILGVNRNTLRRKLTERGVRAPTRRAPTRRTRASRAGSASDSSGA